MASETIFHDLTLLLHPVQLKGPPRHWAVAVGAGADAQCPVQQVSQLGHGASAEVGQRSPILILTAVGDLVRENGQILLVPSRQKDVIPQRNRASSAEQKNQFAQ
jgi:hypothetical protein